MRNLLECLNHISNLVPRTQDAVRGKRTLNALELVEQVQFAAASAIASLKQELYEEFPEGVDRVLLVESDDSRRSKMAEQLRAVGFLVAEVSDGVDAIEYLYEMPRPDAVITDLLMADCDGWELVSIARTSRVGLGVRMVAVTDYNDEGRPLPDLDLVMEKQISPEELAQAVRKLVDQQPAGDVRSATNGTTKAAAKNRAS